MSSVSNSRSNSPSPKASSRPSSPSRSGSLRSKSRTSFHNDSQGVETTPAQNPFAPNFASSNPLAPHNALSPMQRPAALPADTVRPQVGLKSINPDHAVLSLRDVPHCQQRAFDVSVQGTGAGALDEHLYPAVAKELSDLIGFVMEHDDCKNFVSVKFTSGTPPTSFAKAEVTVPTGPGTTTVITLGGQSPKNRGKNDLTKDGRSYATLFQTHLGFLQRLLTGEQKDWTFEVTGADTRNEEIKKQKNAKAAENARAAADAEHSA